MTRTCAIVFECFRKCITETFVKRGSLWFVNLTEFFTETIPNIKWNNIRVECTLRRAVFSFQTMNSVDENQRSEPKFSDKEILKIFDAVYLALLLSKLGVPNIHVWFEMKTRSNIKTREMSVSWKLELRFSKTRIEDLAHSGSRSYWTSFIVSNKHQDGNQPKVRKYSINKHS